MTKFFDLLDVFAGLKSQITGFLLAVYDLLVAFDLVHVTDAQFAKINVAGGALFALFVAMKMQRQKAKA